MHSAPNLMKVSLISPYEIGRQPFALAQPAAWLSRESFSPVCQDLSIAPLDFDLIDGSGVIAIHLAMHTAARLAATIIPAIRERCPDAQICVFGLYAPVNETYFRSLGVGQVFGGESESDLLEFCRSVRDGVSPQIVNGPKGRVSKIQFVVPDREGLPGLDEYSRLIMQDGSVKTVGFVEASRGCKHLCKHCPVVPVYEGKFRVVNRSVVMEDIRGQLACGAEHISFGDPDFLNGPTHARKIIGEMHAAYPDLTWDATIKIEHLLKHSGLIREFADRRCLFLTSAVESTEDLVLHKLDKGHTCDDFERALAMMRRVGIFMAPTFVPFTPWTTLHGYCGLLRKIAELNLVQSVAPVQLSIRVLLPQGSHLLQSTDRSLWLKEFNPELLGYDWSHPDAAVDQLHDRIQRWVMDSEQRDRSRIEAFEGIWEIAHQAAGLKSGDIPLQSAESVPQMTESWYCCAEPTAGQLAQVV